MTLKACCSKIYSIIKRQMWLASLWFAILFFALPVHTALRIQDLRNWHMGNVGFTTWQANFLERATSGLLEVFGQNSMILVWVLMPMAFISALVFGGYMHKQRQVDFYHSQPLRRQTLLLQNGAAGLLSLLLPYLANLLLTIMVVVVMGAGAAIPWGGLFSGIAVHMLYCTAIFATVMLAVVISGNGAVALITGLFLLGVLPALLGLGLTMAHQFYPTFYSILYDWQGIVRWLSPAAAYVCVPLNGLPHTIFPIIIYDALIIAGTVALYRKRPSEAAGQAIAFKLAKPILKYLMATLAACGFAFVFHSISNGGKMDFWWYFGAVTGAFLATQITEIVYAFDFRAIRRNLRGWAIFTVAFLALSTGAINDITGFNSHVPEEQQVAKAEVYLIGVNRHVYDGWGYNYGYNNVYQDEMDWIIRGEKDYLAKGPLESKAGIAAAVNMASRFANSYLPADKQQPDVSEEQRALWQQEGKDYLLGYLGNDHSWEGVSIHPNTASLRVVFTLENGSKIARNYDNIHIPIQIMLEDIQTIYAEEGFCAAQLSELNHEPQQYLPEQLEIFEAYHDISALPVLNVEQRGQLITALRTDLSRLTVEEQLQAMPVGALRMRLYAGAVDYDEMDVERNSRPCRIQRWPIYASFSNTLALMEQWGYGAELWQPNLEAVRTVNLFKNYNYLGDGKYATPVSISQTSGTLTYTTSVQVQSMVAGESTPITDPAEMAQLIQQSYPAEAAELNSFIDIDSRMELEVMYEGLGGQSFYTRRVFPY